MILNSGIDSGRPFDWGRVSEDYVKYRDIYPREFYQRIIDAGLCVKGQKVLDLGTGTGVLPYNLYRYGADFVGVDISENQIFQARKLAAENGMDIHYIVSSAEDIDFPRGTFDVVIACQCFIYFDQGIVLPKIHRILKDTGHFCILWMAWLPDEDPIAKASEELVLKYNPLWSGAHYQRQPAQEPGWAAPLFCLRQGQSYDIALPFTRESWHGRIKACRGIGASSLSEEEILAFEQEHLSLLANFPERFEILHNVLLLDFVKQ